MRKAMRDGGRLGVIDFAPGAFWFNFGRPDDASRQRTGHGVTMAEARAEITGAGFQLEREIPDWAGPMWLMVFTAR